MKYYHITAELKAPLMIQQNRQAYASSTLDYIPGSSLRGAIAAAYLRSGGDAEADDFQNMFIRNPVFFPDLLPMAGSEGVSRVLPVTAVSCKRKSGFRRTDGKKHGVRDVLAVTAASRLHREPADKTYWVCPNCEEDMKPFSGYWNGDVTAPRKADPALISHRHTGIDRATGTVAPSIFYMTQALADFHKPSDGKEFQAQCLSGGVFLDEDQFKTLQQILEIPIFVGADRTRGLGEISIKPVETDPPEFDVQTWHAAFTKKLSLWTDAVPPGTFFSITLESHTILADQFLRPASEIEALENPDIEPVMKIIKPVTIRGWHSAWGLAKPDEQGISAGSVYLFRYTGDDSKALTERLNLLSAGGIGFRREEGFGRVCICDQLHVAEDIL